MYILRILLVVFFLHSASGYAQHEQNMRIAFSQHYGFIADVSYDYHNIINRHMVPIELQISKPSACNEYSNFLCANTSYGLSLYYVDLGNIKVLGDLISPMLFIHQDVLSFSRFSLALKASLGMAFVTRKFHPTDNYKNTIFSKYANAAFGFALATYYKWNTNRLGFGIVFNHFSNGQTKLPNGGMNIPSLTLQYARDFSTDFSLPKAKLIKSQPGLSIYMVPTFGWKESEPYNGPKFLAASFSGEISYAVTSLNNLGLGLTIFYDASDISELKEQGDTISGIFNQILPGVYFNHEFNFYPLLISYQTGILLFNKQFIGEDEFFNRMGIRYFIHPGLFLHFTHLSRFFFKGMNLEWGIGIRL